MKAVGKVERKDVKIAVVANRVREYTLIFEELDEYLGLAPEEDYHFLALNPQLFEYADFVSPATHIPVAQLNLREMSRMVLQENYGGIAGHYLLITDARMQDHHAHSQKVGTAYICSRNSLFREINRGVDWIFSNHACRIQNILNKAIRIT